MAQFKKLTGADGNDILINLDQVTTIKRMPRGSRISFATSEDDTVDVSQEPDEVIND